MNYTNTAEQNVIALPGTSPSAELLTLIPIWYRRATTRRQLARLDQRELQDIGVDGAAARAEARKPFWKA